MEHHTIKKGSLLLIYEEEGLVEVSASLSQNDHNVKSIACNIFGSTEKILLLIDALEYNTNLQELVLRHLYLRPGEAVEMANKLAYKNKTLQALSVLGDYMQLEGAKAFANMIRRNVSLRSLRIEMGDLVSEVHLHKMVRAFYEAMRCNITLHKMEVAMFEFPQTQVMRRWAKENKWVDHHFISATLETEGLLPFILKKTDRITMRFHCLYQRMDLICCCLRHRDRN